MITLASSLYNSVSAFFADGCSNLVYDAQE
jgi:hypothetical protein